LFKTVLLQDLILFNFISFCKTLTGIIRAFSYASTQKIPFLGSFNCKLETVEGIKCSSDMRVTKAEKSGNLIGFETCKNLGLTELSDSVKVNQVSQSTKTDQLISQYGEMF
jgi:hypothetical protein